MACREELKKRRSSAQAVFTRKANSIVFNIDLLTEHDLMSECRMLKDSYSEVCDSSFDYIAAMEEEDAGGFAKEIAEVEKKLQDCRSKYQTTEMKLKEASWSRCASGQCGGGVVLGAAAGEEWCGELNGAVLVSQVKTADGVLD